MAWLARNNFTASDYLHGDDLNNLANDIRTWGGDVNGGGHVLANVKLDQTGGFQYYVSPLEVVPAAAGQKAATQYDQLVGSTQVARWSAGTDGTTETGSNAGSNYAIVRYSDAGAVLGTAVAINRASGNVGVGVTPAYKLDVAGDLNITGTYRVNGVPISTGGGGAAQTPWTSNIDGGGFALANTSSVTIKTSRLKSAATPGLGATGSLSLTSSEATSPLTAVMQLFTDPTPANRRLGLGILDGSVGWFNITLCESGGNVGIATAAPAYKLDVAGDLNITGVYRVNGVPISTGGGGGVQTPWASDINANNFMLYSAKSIGIGIGAPIRNLHIASVPAGGGMAVTGSAPNYSLSNANTDPNGNTSTVIWALATAAGNYGLPNAGDCMVASMGTARGNLYLDANYSGGGTARNVILQYMGGGGNVGINTNTPGSPLTLLSNAANAFVITGASANSTGLLINNTAAGGHAWAIGSSGGGPGPAGALVFFDSTAGAPRVTMDASGNVIVGGSGPARALFDVVGALSCSTQMVLNAPAKAIGANTALMITSTTDGANPLQGMVQLITHATSASRRLSIGCVEQGIMWHSVTLAEAGGNVGIGTANPAYAVDIVGDCNITGTYRVNGVAISTGGGGGVTSLAGTAGQINVSASTGAVTVSIPSSPQLTGDANVSGNLNIGGVYKINGIPISTGGGVTTRTQPAGRALNSTYQNTSGKPMFVAVVASVNSGTYLQLFTDGNTSPGTMTSDFYNPAGASATVTVSAWVLPGEYYRTAASGGLLAYWTEWT